MLTFGLIQVLFNHGQLSKEIDMEYGMSLIIIGQLQNTQESTYFCFFSDRESIVIVKLSMLSFQCDVCFETREFKHVVEKISVCMRVVVVWTQASAKTTGPIFFQLRKPRPKSIRGDFFGKISLTLVLAKHIYFLNLYWHRVYIYIYISYINLAVGIQSILNGLERPIFYFHQFYYRINLYGFIGMFLPI